MAYQWQGIIKEYIDHLPIAKGEHIFSLGEGGTPLIKSRILSEITKGNVYIKNEGMNPTGSFKDRGMSLAITKAKSNNSQAVICASTGNTSASAAAYASISNLKCAVIIPENSISVNKLSQAKSHNAELIQVKGNFDDCLKIAVELSNNYPFCLVNSLNSFRIEGQKTASFEIVDSLNLFPDIHILPIGNAGNITAYWKGYKEYYNIMKLKFKKLNKRIQLPSMWGFQADGAAPFVYGRPINNPTTIASAIRIGNPASWKLALKAKKESSGLIDVVTDEEILKAQKLLSNKEGIFVEPASASGIAGILKYKNKKYNFKGLTIVITVTGHGLKDASWAFRKNISGDSKEDRMNVKTFSIHDIKNIAQVLL